MIYSRAWEASIVAVHPRDARSEVGAVGDAAVAHIALFLMLCSRVKVVCSASESCFNGVCVHNEKMLGHCDAAVHRLPRSLQLL